MVGAAFGTMGDGIQYICFKHMSTILTPDDIMTEMDMASFDGQYLPIHDKTGDLFTRLFDQPGKGRPGYVHFIGRFLM